MFLRVLYLRVFSVRNYTSLNAGLSVSNYTSLNAGLSGLTACLEVIS
jgi:hypothetical protein